MRLITLLISLLVVSVAAAQTTNRCDQITPGRFDPQELISFNPYFMYRSTAGAFNCSTTQFVGPAGIDTSYAWTCIIINGDKAITHDVTLTGNTLNLKQCSDGSVLVLSVLYVHLYSAGNASFCVYNCDSQGVNISALHCLGRTPQDAVYIQYYLATQIKVPITGPLYYSQSDCPKAKNCVAYT